MSRAAVLCGLGHALPATIVTNDDLASRLDTTHEWIHSRTGISQRHVLEPGQATSDLAAEAGARALRSAQLQAEDVDIVVLATATPDHPVPATAPVVANMLGAADAGAFDVAAVCSGFVYALAVCAGMIVSELAERALVIGADAFSTIVDPDDRSTVPIFGDGGGAVVLRAGDSGEPGALLHFDLGSDGANANLIQIPAGGSRQRATKVTADPADHYFAMEGRSVYRHAVARMAASTRAVMKKSDWGITSVDWLVGHQANSRILQSVAHHLQLPPERAVIAIENVGNTSAASIPLALAEAAADGRFKPGERVVLTAFGGGLTWGSATLTWPGLGAEDLDTSAEWESAS